MADYKLYFLDSNSHIRRRLDLECESDEHAVEVVSEHVPYGGVELWQAGRLVKRFEVREFEPTDVQAADFQAADFKSSGVLP